MEEKVIEEVAQAEARKAVQPDLKSIRLQQKIEAVNDVRFGRKERPKRKSAIDEKIDERKKEIIEEEKSKIGA